MRISLGLAAALLASAAATAQMSDSADDGPPAFVTGTVPATAEEYDRTPKLDRHRAWLPRSVDLSASFPEPGRQGQQPDCVAWATTYAARSYIYGKDLGRRPAAADVLSPAYVYNRVRAPGSQCVRPIKVMAALDLLKNEGTVSFADFPDDPAKCDIPAPASLRDKASRFRISDWRAVDREKRDDHDSPLQLDDVKGALARGTPVVFSIPISPEFYHWKSDAIYSTQVRPDPEFHTMALVGYDEDRQAFRLLNSWGRHWGDHGYAWIDYATFKLLAVEAYALEAPLPVSNAPPPSPDQAFRTELATFQCGAVQVAQSHGRQVITGYGGVQSSLDRLRAAAMAASPRTDWQVAYHPWPQCEAETTLGPALGPALGGDGIALQAVDDAGKPLGGDPVAMRAGDKFGFVARASDAQPYLSIVYLQADGSAVELYRGQPGGHAVTLGTGGAQQLRFQVGAPYGNEVLIALASARPLFGAELESYATERQFLTGLRAHLLEAPRGSVAAAVLRLKTAG